ncbi:MAG TPA: hypothetical protein PKA83_12910 [Pirellulaceae bacterium]|nr:hypothetical protein [Pirellulaceae bacterium]
MNSNLLLSIIVPWMGDDAQYETTLATILRYQPERSEVLVPHGPRFVDRFGLSGEVQFVRCASDSPGISQRSSEPGLSALLQEAVKQASGSVIHLVLPGIEVCEYWTQKPVATICNDNQVGMVAIPVQHNRAHRPRRIQGIELTERIVRRLVQQDNETNGEHAWREQGLIGPSAWCAFYDRLALNRYFSNRTGCCGGLANTEVDVDIALTLKSLDYLFEFVTQPAVTCEFDLARKEQQFTSFESQRLRIRHADLLPAMTVWERGRHLLSDLIDRLTFKSRHRTSLTRAQVRRVFEADANFARAKAADIHADARPSRRAA